MLKFIKKPNITVLAAIVIAGVLAWASFQAIAGNTGNTEGYAWGEDIGWIRFDGMVSSQDYGVIVPLGDGDDLSGYAWSENVGWIKFAGSCDEAGGCPGGGDTYSVVSTETGCTAGDKCLSGYGWGEGAGWIKFAATSTDYTNTSTTTYGVYIDSSDNWQGYAFGEQVGWIKFAGSCDDTGGCPGGGDTYGVGQISISNTTAGIKITATGGDIVIANNKINITSSSGDEFRGILLYGSGVTGVTIIGNEITVTGAASSHYGIEAKYADAIIIRNIINADDIDIAANLESFIVTTGQNRLIGAGYSFSVNHSSGLIETANDYYDSVANTGTFRDMTGARKYTCTASEAEGDAVYLSAADTVARADADSLSSLDSLGFVVKKSSSTECVVKIRGKIYSMTDDNSAALTPGAIYYLSGAAGKITADPGANAYAQPVGVAKSASVLEINIENIGARTMLASTAGNALTIRQNGSGNIMSLLDSSGNSVFLADNSGLIGLGDTTPDFGLEIAASSSSGYLAVSSGADQDGDIFIIDVNGNIGIGTTSPLAKLDIYGDMMLSGADRYINFSSATSSDGYGFRDYSGVMQFRDSTGNWTTFSTSSVFALADLNDVDTTDVGFGNLIYYNGSSWEDIATGSLGLLASSDINTYSELNNIVGDVTLTHNGLIDTLSELNVIVADATIASTSSAMTGTFDGIDFTNGTLAANALWYGGSGSAPEELATGTAGQILGVSAGGAPAWVSTSSLGLLGSSTIDSLNNNYLARWDGSKFIDSLAYDTGIYLGIGTTTPSALFHISSTGAYDLLRIDDNGAGDTSPFIIDMNGNMAIGTTTAAGKLTVMSDSGSQLRLAYDADTYFNFTVASNGEMTIAGSGSGGSILQIGNDNEEDAGLIMDGNAVDFWLALDDTDDKFKIGTSSTIGSSTLLTIDADGLCVTGDTLLPIVQDNLINPKTASGEETALESGGEQGSRTPYPVKGTGRVSVNGASTGALLSSDRRDYNYSIDNKNDQYKNTSTKSEDVFTGTLGIGVPPTDTYLQYSTLENPVNPSDKNNENLAYYSVEYMQIKDVKPGMEVMSLNEKTGKLEPAKIRALIDMGVKPIYEIETEDGKKIRTTGNHPYLVSLNAQNGYEDTEKEDTEKVESEDDKYNNLVFDVFFGVDFSDSDYIFGMVNIKNNSDADADSQAINRRIPAEFSDIPMAERMRQGTQLFNFTNNFISSDFIKSAQIFDSFIGKLVGKHNYGIKNSFSTSLASTQPLLAPHSSIMALCRLRAAGVSNSLSHSLNSFSNAKPATKSLSAFEKSLVLGSKTPTTDLSLINNGCDNDNGFINLEVKSNNNYSKDNYTKSTSDLSNSQWVKVRDLRAGNKIAVADDNLEGIKFVKIKRIKKLPKERVYDIEVEGTHNFVANDIIAHNTYIYGNVGVGTTTPTNKLDVYGNLGILNNNELRLYESVANGSSYVGFQASTTLAGNQIWTLPAADGTSGYALTTDGSGQLAWANTGSGGTLNYGQTGSLAFYSSAGTTATGTDISKIVWDNSNYRLGIGTSSPLSLLSLKAPAGSNDIFTIASSTGTNLLTFDYRGYLGIGTTSPTQKLSTDGLMFIGGTGTSTISDNLHVLGDFKVGTSSFVVNSSGVVTSGTWSGGIINPTYGGSGTTTQFTSGSVLFAGASGIYTQDNSNLFWDNSNNRLGIGTSSPYAKLTVWGDGTGTGKLMELVDSASTTRMVVLENGRVGIGTSSPEAQLNIYTALSASTSPSLLIQSEATATTSDGLLKIVSNYSSGGNVIFKVDEAGDVYNEGGNYSTGADYAEYFWTADTDLKSGEVVCVDVARDNAVKRCERGADGNVMGIVSTKPAIVGNAKDEFLNNENYKIIGMLGQVPAMVSAENGEIRPGDSLTSASSTQGYVMRAEPGDPTVGVALEGLDVAKGVINVLISRRNKSLTVEMVESKITDRIAAMEIEDEVAIMLASAIEDYNIASSVEQVVDDQIAMFDSRLTVEIDSVSGELMVVAASVDDVIARLAIAENNIDEIFNFQFSMINEFSIFNDQLSKISSSSLERNIVVTDEGNICVGTGQCPVPTAVDVAVVEIVTATATVKTAFVVNQAGDGDVADFRYDEVSIMNIADSGRVTVVGEMLVDGRIMVCSGGACGNALDEAVDETMGDMGVEGKVVAGAFEAYCEDGYVWVPGSAKYGTMPGFCVETHEHRTNNNELNEFNFWVNITQGEAQMACQGIGDGYHLVSENEWMTMAENIIRVGENDVDLINNGLQLATAASSTIASSTIENASSSIAFTLSNGNYIYNLAGGATEWTDQIITAESLIKPASGEWREYYEIEDYQGFNIAPPYYYTSANGIGRIKTDAATTTDGYLRGFARGETALFDLDLSYSPTEATSTVGFRCAR